MEKKTVYNKEAPEIEASASSKSPSFFPAISFTVVILVLLAAGAFFILTRNQNQSNTELSENSEENQGQPCMIEYTSIEEAMVKPDDVCILDLTDQALTEIPEEIGSFPNLNTLILTGNNISEDNKTAIDEALSKRDPQVGYTIQF